MNSSDLSTEFRLNEINKIKDYFESEIKEQEVVVKKLSKIITSFNYTEQTFIALNAAFGSISILSHAIDNILAKYIEIVSSIFIVAFSLIIGVMKKLLIGTRKNKKKHSKIIMLAKSGLNKIETLISEALIDLKIGHEEFKIIIDEKQNYDKMRENIRNIENKNDISKNV